MLSDTRLRQSPHNAREEMILPFRARPRTKSCPWSREKRPSQSARGGVVFELWGCTNARRSPDASHWWSSWFPGDLEAGPSQALTHSKRSQIVLQIFEHVVGVVARIEIDLVVDRAILEPNRALRSKTARQALDLLFDGFLAGRGVTDAPHGLERCAAVTVGAVNLPVLRRRRLQPVKLRGETVAAPLVGGGDLPREILLLLSEILLVLQRLRKRNRGDDREPDEGDTDVDIHGW